VGLVRLKLLSKASAGEEGKYELEYKNSPMGISIPVCSSAITKWLLKLCAVIT
jgi:hypothetical protein